MYKEENAFLFWFRKQINLRTDKEKLFRIFTMHSLSVKGSVEILEHDNKAQLSEECHRKAFGGY